MCDFVDISFRRGTVVEAAEKPYFWPVKQKKIIENDISVARSIGKTIVANADKYMRELHEILKTRLDVAVKDRRLSAWDIDKAKVHVVDTESVKARFDPGLILDFPSIKIITERDVISLRCCITVCANGSKSKVWSRFTTEPSDNHIPMSDTEVADFHSLAEDITGHLNSAVRSQYETDFGEHFATNINLDKVGEINIFGIGCSGESISKDIQESYNSLISRGANKSIIHGLETSKIMRKITKLAIPVESLDETGTPEFSASENSILIPLVTDDGSKTIFIAHSDKQTAYVAGLINVDPIGSSDHSQQHSRRLSKSFAATGDIASLIGSAF